MIKEIPLKTVSFKKKMLIQITFTSDVPTQILPAKFIQHLTLRAFFIETAAEELET